MLRPLEFAAVSKVSAPNAGRNWYVRGAKRLILVVRPVDDRVGELGSVLDVFAARQFLGDLLNEQPLQPVRGNGANAVVSQRGKVWRARLRRYILRPPRALIRNLRTPFGRKSDCRFHQPTER
jgi:hypothetical protein